MRPKPLLVLVAALAACSTPPPVGYPLTRTEEREACAAHNPERNLYFGDLHVHTAHSFDAYANLVRTTPADAYRFARGEVVSVLAGGALQAQLDRPLDFAAVTDHAEYFGEVSSCADPSSPGYGSPDCVTFRGDSASSIFAYGARLTSTPDRFSVCAGGACDGRVRSVWRSIQDDAAAAYDTSAACSFTTFVGYEYSAAPGVSNLHRNVLFRSAVVPAVPTSFFEEPNPSGLWRALERDCDGAGTGCQSLSIPHNSNLSNGRMFLVQSAENGSAADQERRARLERLVEVFQHKGDSECMNGLALSVGGTDELCDFEKTRSAQDDCGTATGTGGLGSLGCVSGRDFVRRALLDGLSYQQGKGVNPLKLGFIASTDTHDGTPGAVEEASWVGHSGQSDATAQTRIDGPTLPPGGVVFNPGGLAAVWAQENSRDGVFEALFRREAYGTSGPRLAVRFFGGAELDADFCSRADAISRAYQRGVPMGGDLPRPAKGARPRFAVMATADLSSPRGVVPLARVEVVKGWLDAQGKPQAKVFPVREGLEGDFAVAPDTCAASGAGATSACATWEDPEFDPGQLAFYYLRVAEAETCRWSQLACLAAPAAQRPAGCATGPALIRERAWTSPIWFSP